MMSYRSRKLNVNVYFIHLIQCATTTANIRYRYSLAHNFHVYASLLTQTFKSYLNYISIPRVYSNTHTQWNRNELICNMGYRTSCALFDAGNELVSVAE